MKNSRLSTLLAGLFILGSTAVQAQVTMTLTSVGTSIRTTGIFPNPNAFDGRGGTSDGDIVGNPDTTTFPGPLSPVRDFNLRWENLDLDGVGGDDDFFTFTVRVTNLTGNGENVTINGEGIGVNGNGGGTLDDGDELQVEVVDVVLSPGVPGAVTFDGFTAAGLGVGAFANSGTVSVDCDINGLLVFVQHFDGPAYQYDVDRALFPLSSTVVFDNVFEISDINSPSGRMRQFDFQFTYDPDATPPPVVKTFTSNNTSIRGNDVFPNTGSNLGGANDGDLFAYPDATTFLGPLGMSRDFSLRWGNIDLDNDGSADDYFDFAVRVSNLLSNGENVVTNNQGIGVGGGGSGNLDTGDELKVEVVDVQVSPGIPGSVTFDGFTEAALGAGVGANGGAVDVGCDINGVPVLVDLPNAGAFQYNVSSASFPIDTTVTFLNVVETEDILAPSGRIRELDLNFTYDSTVAPPPTVLTTSGLSLRPDAFYVYPNTVGANQGGANRGEITGPPGFDTTTITFGTTTDFPLRWSDLDLDNTGTNDDYIDFILRATSNTSDNVSFSGEGIGIGDGTTAGLDFGEVLSFEVVEVLLSPGTPGSVTFDGFSEGVFFASANGGVDNTTIGSAMALVNGITVQIDLDGIGYEPGTSAASFPLTDTVVFSNPTYTGPNIPTGRAREFEFQFTYSQEAVVAPTSNPVISLVDLNTGTDDLTITTIDVIDGETYHVEFSPDLTTPFAPLLGSEETAGGGQVVHIVNVGTATKGYFRVVQGEIP
ncbi:MAG: hypothetical protein AAGA58_17185 [Verrucomicrobiota bacterium]